MKCFVVSTFCRISLTWWIERKMIRNIRLGFPNYVENVAVLQTKIKNQRTKEEENTWYYLVIEHCWKFNEHCHLQTICKCQVLISSFCLLHHQTVHQTFIRRSSVRGKIKCIRPTRLGDEPEVDASFAQCLSAWPMPAPRRQDAGSGPYLRSHPSLCLV